MLRYTSPCSFRFLPALLIGAIGSVVGGSFAYAQFELREVQPTIAWGGRVVAVDVLWRAPLRDHDTILAASPSGGVFRSLDGGDSWEHVPYQSAAGPAYPHRLNNLRAFPTSPYHAVLTAPADWRNLTLGGRVVSGGGIWLTRDSGRTWEKPATAEPPALCGGRASAWGIAIEPATPTAADKIYVGTDCGLAVSLDGGATWTHQQVNGRTEPVYSVIARDGVVDVCSATNHFRLDTRTGTWSGGNLPGACWSNYSRALAVSPLDRNVIFAAFNMRGCKHVYESDDGGGTWFSLNAPQEPEPPVGQGCAGGRESYVGVAPRADASGRFDLYYGVGVRSYRIQSCGAATRMARSCAADAWQDLWGLGLLHNDHMDVAFSRSLGSPNCASFIASDAGVYRSTDCGTSWIMGGSGTRGFHALQIYDVYTQVYDSGTHVYIGTQDNDLWASPDGGASWPPENTVCCEGGWFALQHRVTDSASQLIVGAGLGVGAFAGTASNFQSDPLLRNALPWVNPDPTTTADQPNGKAWGQPVFLERNTYLQWSEPGKMWLTTDPTGPWTQVFSLPAAWPLPSGTGWLTTGPAREPILYIPIEMTAGDLTDVRLVRVTNFRGGRAAFAAADTCTATAGTTTRCLNIGIHSRDFAWKRLVAADRNRPDRLMAVDRQDRVIKTSRNGGAHWDPDANLTNLVIGLNPATGRSEFVFDRGDTFRTSFVSAMAFDPFVEGRIFVGTEANGIFMSTNDGGTWIKIPDTQQIPVVTSFDFDEVRGVIYVSSYGRGLWTLRVPTPVRPDRLEENNRFETATVLGTGALTHTHLSPSDAETNPAFRGSTVEMWRWTIDRLTLHDWEDRDYFRLRLPDPTRAQAGAHPGLSECAVLERTPRFPDHEIAQLVIAGELSVTITGGSRDEAIRVFPVEGGVIRRDRELAPTIPCPWTSGLREVAIAFGERDDAAVRPRSDFSEYSLSVTYRIDLQYLSRPSSLVAGLAAAKELARFHMLYCRGGLFPFCFGQDTLRLTAPGRALGIPDCRADGPGCPMFYGFLWPETIRPLAIELQGSHSMRARLIDATGKGLAEARLVSKLENRALFSLQAGQLKAGFYAFELSNAGPGVMLTVPRARWRNEARWVSAGRSFDGDWEVNATAVQGCALKTWTSRLTIKGTQIVEEGAVRGVITADGNFQYTRPAPANPNVVGPFTGKLQGDTGTGTYRFAPACTGSISLKRM
jgi:hypothetical protein